jgi:hypothetical protein
VLGVERPDQPLEQPHQLALGPAQVAPEPRQERRRAIAHEAIVTDGARDCVFGLLGREQPIRERRQHSPGDRRAAVVTECQPSAP